MIIKTNTDSNVVKKAHQAAKEIAKLRKQTWDTRLTANSAAADLTVGFICELAAQRALQRKFEIIQRVDMGLNDYQTRSADLAILIDGARFDVHVKSCRSTQDEISWIYQKSCGYLHKDLHALCICDCCAGLITVDISIYRGKDLIYQPLRANAPSKIAVYQINLEGVTPWLA